MNRSQGGAAYAAWQHQRDRRVASLIEHAWHKVPYYRDLMTSHGLRPGDIQSIEELKRFPISKKQDFRDAELNALVSTGRKQKSLVHHRTSGSTGQPLDIRRSWWEERRYGAYRWQVLWQFGWRPWMRHTEIEELQPTDNGDRRLAHKLSQSIGLFRQQRVQALQSPQQIIESLVAWPAPAISGYTGVIARVAKYALEHAIELPKAMFVACHSDTLTPGIRQQIGAAFRAPVYEIYDAYECNVIAWQCPESSLLLTADECCAVEVVVDGRPADPGETGEVVLTALYSRVMPFIRFAIGDLAKVADNSNSGRFNGALSVVEGRTVEYFALPDGRMVHPYEIYACIGDTRWITQYQLIQEKSDRFELQIVCSSPPSSGLLTATRQAIESFLGDDVVLTLTTLDYIKPSESGKTPAFRSLVVNT